MLPNFSGNFFLRLVVVALALAIESLVQATRSLADELATPLKVAQCRSHCVHTFIPKNHSKTSCHQHRDCSMCWETCQDIQSNAQDRDYICSLKDTCFPGCKAACQLSMQLPNQRLPLLVYDSGEKVLRIEGSQAHWPEPSEDDSPWVYLVLTRVPSPGQSVSALQTLELSLQLPEETSGDATETMRVLVIGRNGLHTVYSPRHSTELPSARETAQEVIRSLGGGSLQGLQIPGEEAQTLFRPFSGEKWNLREISRVRQESIVSTHITWDPRRSKALYLVTWEIDGGGLQGNLFTESSTVNLSLWSDTVFHIQVGIVGGQRSEKITVNTSLRVRVASNPLLIGIAPSGMYMSPNAACMALLLATLVLTLTVTVWRVRMSNSVSDRCYPDHSIKNLPRFSRKPNCDTDLLIKSAVNRSDSPLKLVT
ncbi:uncharacterized protein LOC111044987 isoform X2 [Nilaparvata lugens]|uniref:uncharacterized protein LOC111044987 isoform X1 n=1 Tax=Nilaparvata lugens TaxID=108931 RepID=UPI00193DB4E0|nr:uncharacterized protein LOC111044987 isoform X1 [Nilaparvata lugens]XP_039293517.1 uncharacterized protein LOC111044987 isoform X2 [Nilaparvata lugens]